MHLTVDVLLRTVEQARAWADGCCTGPLGLGLRASFSGCFSCLFSAVAILSVYFSLEQAQEMLPVKNLWLYGQVRPPL